MVRSPTGAEASEVSAVQTCSFTSGVIWMFSRIRIATIQSAAQARSDVSWMRASGCRETDVSEASAFQPEKKQRHSRHKGVGQRRVEAVEEEASAVVDGIGRALGLIEIGLDGGGDPGIAAFARNAIVEDTGAKIPETPPHQLREHTFDQREIFVGFDDCKQRVGTGRKVREMIACCRHNEVEVTINLLAVAFGDDCFEGSCSLFESGARLCGVAIEFAKAKAESEKRIAVGMQIIAELRCEGWRIGRKLTVAPNDCAGLAACDEATSKAGSHCFCDIGRNRFRRCWHRQSLDHKQRR